MGKIDFFKSFPWTSYHHLPTLVTSHTSHESWGLCWNVSIIWSNLALPPPPVGWRLSWGLEGPSVSQSLSGPANTHNKDQTQSSSFRYSINVSPVQISFPSVVPRPVNILTECFDTRTILAGLLGPTDTRYWSMKYEVSCSVLSSPSGHHYHHYHHASAHSAGLRPAPTRAHLQANDLSAFWVITNTNSSLVTIYYAQKSFRSCMNPLLLPAWSWIFHIYSVPTANCLRVSDCTHLTVLSRLGTPAVPPPK